MPRCDSNPTSQTKRWRRFAERWMSAKRNSRPSARRRAVKRDSKPAHRRISRLSSRALRAATKATLTKGVEVGPAAAKLHASEVKALRATATAEPGVSEAKAALATATVKVSVSEARAARATSTAKPGVNGVKLAKATSTEMVSVNEAKAAKVTATMKVSVNAAKATATVKLVSEARVAKLRALKVSVPAPKALRLRLVRVNGNEATAARVVSLPPVARVAVHEGSGRPSGF